MEITSGIQKDFLRFDTEMTITEMLGLLKKAGSKSGLVFRKGKYVGLVEKKNLLRVNLDPTIAKIGKHLHAAPVINEHADVIETAHVLFQSNADFVPVASANTIVGVLPLVSLLTLAADLEETRDVRVGDLQLVKSGKVMADYPLSKALEIMFKEKAEEVPVFDMEGVSGILSIQDLFQKFMVWPAKREYSAKMKKEKGGSRSADVDSVPFVSLPVSTFSTNTNLKTIDIKDRFGDAVAMLKKHNISSLLVYSGKEYVGLLTTKGMARYVASLEVPRNFNIQFIGLNEVLLSAYDRESVKKVAANESFKLQRLLHNDFKLLIHLKSYDKDGKRQKYSVTMRVNYPGRLIEATAADWFVLSALHGAFDAMKNEIKKTFRKTQGRRTSVRVRPR